jgi:putative transposase
MPRAARVDVGDNFYHVINRAIMRLPIFTNDEEYLHFEKLIKEAVAEVDVEIIAYTIMPNHWHFLIRTKNDGDLGLFMHRLTSTHTRQVKVKTGTVGTGPIYQGRYKSFIIENGRYLSAVFKYIERNPVRAKLVERVEDWRWGSAWRRFRGSFKQKELLSDLPMSIFDDYPAWINVAESIDEVEGVRKSVNKNAPYGSESWLEKTVIQFNLQMTLRNPGRPPKF